jgi:hypothetical protein
MDAWVTLIQPLLLNVDTAAELPSDGDLEVAFQMLAVIVSQLERQALAMTEIVDELYNCKLLKYTDAERGLANQLVFAAIGWISKWMLHNSSIYTNPDTNFRHSLSSLAKPPKTQFSASGPSPETKTATSEIWIFKDIYPL